MITPYFPVSPVPIHVNHQAPAYLRGRYGIVTGRLVNHDGSTPLAAIIVRLEKTDRLFAVRRAWLDHDRRRWKLLAKFPTTPEHAPPDLAIELTGSRLDMLLKWAVEYSGIYERGVLFVEDAGRFKPVTRLSEAVSL